MSIWQVNTAENYEYVEADYLEPDSRGWLLAYGKDDEEENPIAGWAEGFWFSYKNVEKVVNEDGGPGELPEMRFEGDTDRADARKA